MTISVIQKQTTSGRLHETIDVIADPSIGRGLSKMKTVTEAQFKSVYIPPEVLFVTDVHISPVKHLSLHASGHIVKPGFIPIILNPWNKQKPVRQTVRL